VLERIPRRWVDVAIAAVAGFVAIANALHLHPTPHVVGAAVVGSLALLWRRTRPLQVLGVASAAGTIALLGGSGDVLPVLLVAFYSVAQFMPRRIALRAALIAATPPAFVVVFDGSAKPYSSVPALVFLAGAWVLGDNARVRREQQEESARQAVADERARIARELHDVVTHNVSVMVVQAAAGNDVFDRRPEQAREALRAVEETGREALSELRRLLDVVSGGNAPQPGLERLDALVEQVRRAGVHVDLTVEGTPRELPPALNLSAFRIVQESLTNTLRHARAAHAAVRVRYVPDRLELEVVDDGVGASSIDGGRGLVGMRERVALFGGELHAGSRPGGGFAVHASLPVEAT
jgi:signal transduction histidine kinase